ncbi:MAG: peptidoglycan DD-metalloendopeptidase family protein [Ilumatobacteraceae bacterium]
MRSQHGRRDRRARWAPGLAVAMLCAASVLAPRAGADSTTSDQVAAQIIAVQDDADAAATKLADLDEEANDLADRVAASQRDVDATQARYDRMESDLATIAMNRYTGSLPQSALPFGASIMDTIQTGQLSQFALGAGEVDLGELGATRRDLDRQQAELAGLQTKNERARQQLAATKESLDDKIASLTTLEARLRDAEVKAAYEAKLEAKRQRDAEAAAAAEAKAAPATTPATVATAARGEGVSDASPATTAATTTATTSPSASDDKPVTTDPPITRPAVTEPPATEASPATTAAPVNTDLACPVAGTRAFGDTWGASRSGGRHHEGTDMISPEGTPLVAMDDGFARMKQTSLGGNSIGLTADDGTYYFYAHLSRFEGGSRHVGKGEVIGYVGHTGDTSVSHLHIEIHPGGGAAVNPYPTIRRIC